MNSHNTVHTMTNNLEKLMPHCSEEALLWLGGEVALVAGSALLGEIAEMMK